MKRQTRLAGLLLALLAGLALGARAELPLDERLARLSRLGTIVYVTAHPDDESAAILTYLARGLHARVVLLCLTRGEGGQNEIGPELGEELGRVRTQELERAAAGYGAEVRFLGAEDFGYSKSVEETLKVWGEEKILGELVRQIRELRPLAVVSHWSGTARDGGGAHHRAAGLLARRAFALASDPQAFPEQLTHGYQPWQPRYLLVRTYDPAEERAFEVPVKQSSPVPGKTYEELGWEAFQHHRSQGMHEIQLSQVTFFRRYGLTVEATRPEGVRAPTSAAELAPGPASLPDFFPTVSILTEWRGRLEELVTLAESSRRLLAENKASEAALALVQGAGLLTALGREIPAEETDTEAASVRALLDARQNEFLEAAAGLAGVELEAATDRATLTPGDPAWVRLGVKVGAPEVFRAVGFQLGSLRLEAPGGWSVEPAAAETTPAEQKAEFVVTIPEKLDFNQPAGLQGRATLTTGSLRLELLGPVRGLTRAPAGEAALEPVSVAPPVTLELEPRLRLIRASPGETTYDWWVRLENHRPEPGKASVWFDVPLGWYTPLPQQVELRPGGAVSVRFSLLLPGRLPPGPYELRAVAGRGRETFTLARHRRPDGNDAPRYAFEPARARVEILDINVPPGLRVGYIGFNNDPTPALLGQLGVAVDMLDERALAAARLEDYDAVVVANRAYDFRGDLKQHNARLLDYAKAGGTLLVEHQGRDWDPAKFAPFPATKAANRNLRVTDETAAVRVLAPDHPLLNFPNKIGPTDWKGWVQERGLYFWESWSENYTPVVELADPGEEPQGGALLYARSGEGVYIYCGLALFRQVRAGVPGGVRLYVNLLSQRRMGTKERVQSTPSGQH